jgi:hypothetical protein
MSLSTVKKAVMWLDHEGNAPIKRPAAISEPGDAPAPWISLRSSVSFSDKSDDAVSIHTSTLQRLKGFTVSKSANLARRVRSVEAVEKKPDYQEGSGRDSRTSITAPIDSSIVYPGKLRLSFICVSLCLSSFMVSLDMSILTTAM